MPQNRRSIASLILFLFVCSLMPAQPAESPPQSPAVVELEELFANIRQQLRAGAKSADDLQRYLGMLDELLAKYAAEKSEGAARIAFMRAAYIDQVIGDSEAASMALDQLITAMPDTEVAAQAQEYAMIIKQKAAQEKALANLVGNPAPELDFTWATQSGLAKLSELKGKVVVLDFWATWCGPCVRSFPQVRDLTEHYRDAPVEVVGVTSLQGRVHGLESTPIDTSDDPEREHALMNDYIAKQNINWTIAFSEQPVFNEQYGVTGIPHMAIIAPDGTLRHRGLHPAMPHDEKVAMIDEILREFDLALPAGS